MIVRTMMLKDFTKPLVRPSDSVRKALIAAVVSTAMFLAPAMSLARSNDSNAEREVYDARLETYPKNVQLDSGSTALTYFLLLVLAGLGLGVLFKNANRSHLD